MKEIWKVSTTYKRAQKGKADICLWEDQSVLVCKNIKYGDACLIVKAVNEYLGKEAKENALSSND